MAATKTRATQRSVGVVPAGTPAYWHDACEHLAKRDRVLKRLIPRFGDASLESRGEPAAIEIAFDCKQRRAVHVIVYALKYERTGAGQLLMERSLRDAFAKRLDVYDLLAPGDSYKLDWADGSIAVLDYALGTSPLGRTFARYYLGIIRPRLKTALNTTARLWRRPDGKNRHNAKVASPSDAA